MQKGNFCETIHNLRVIFDQWCKEYKERDATAKPWEQIAGSL